MAKFLGAAIVNTRHCKKIYIKLMPKLDGNKESLQGGKVHKSYTERGSSNAMK